jgi:hypothetical protein
MDDEFEDMVMLPITPRQFRKWDFAAIGLQTAARLAGAISDGLVDLSGVLLRQSEYEESRHNFHEEAAYDMEQLIAEVEGKD